MASDSDVAERGLIQLWPRQGTVQVSCGRTVLVSGEDGVITGKRAVEGLYVYETRMLSRYQWLINGKSPEFSCGSNVRQVAGRMLMSDLFSGWGVRTLSSRHPAYNPFSYHRGSVWPVENAAFVLAFSRYGLHEEMHRLAKAIFEAARPFQHDRLPEVFGGHQRTAETPFPGLYTRADWPQAWSASAPLAILQALAGIYPYAPAKLLFVDPRLPEWLPEITIERLRVGKGIVTLRLFRDSDGETDYEVLRLDGPLHIIRQPSPWSLTTGWAERIKDVVTSFQPGRSKP